MTASWPSGMADPGLAYAWSVLEATRTFITRYAGAEVRLIAGRDQVAEDHELARRYPACFRPVPGAPAGARTSFAYSDAGPVVCTSSTLPAEPSGFERWRMARSTPGVAVSTRLSGTRVRFSSPARVALLAEVKRGDGRTETGGVLFGSTGHELVEVLAASGPGPGAGRGLDFYRSDGAHDLAVAEEMAERGLSIVGEWHSHPRGSGMPSPEDLQTFSGRRRALDLERYLTVLAAQTRAGWELVGWVTRAAGKVDICRPARFRLAA